ncbi:uncharacterized protein LOC122518047 isoform X1 [Polistes fuscatus]|uniref:uncharacterized protein LOC122518047 isoform X1 n=1 Tax=Polistes fuscatus TaxID=30207 RepID=UPI001CA7EE1F|nr:uncharacterized protein LOC122518047 isoform X1 [Polistes fuscatus]
MSAMSRGPPRARGPTRIIERTTPNLGRGRTRGIILNNIVNLKFVLLVILVTVLVPSVLAEKSKEYQMSDICKKYFMRDLYRKIDGAVLTSKHERDLDCAITFQTHSILQRFMLRFDQLQLDCNDHLYIYDGAHAVGSYKADLSCRNTKNSVGAIYTRTNFVTLKYVTDAWGTNMNGFRLVITAVKDPKHTCKDFRCTQNEFCIETDLLCDGVNHCGDGSDEATSTLCANSEASTILGMQTTWFAAAFVFLLLSMTGLITAAVFCFCRQRASTPRHPHNAHNAQTHPPVSFPWIRSSWWRCARYVLIHREVSLSSYEQHVSLWTVSSRSSYDKVLHLLLFLFHLLHFKEDDTKNKKKDQAKNNKEKVEEEEEEEEEEEKKKKNNINEEEGGGYITGEVFSSINSNSSSSSSFFLFFFFYYLFSSLKKLGSMRRRSWKMTSHENTTTINTTRNRNRYNPINTLLTIIVFCLILSINKIEAVEDSNNIVIGNVDNDISKDYFIGPCLVNTNQTCPDDEVTFFLYTRKNLFKGQRIVVSDTDSNLDDTNFDSSNPTKIIVHGYNSDMQLSSLIDVRDEYLKKGEYNLIAIDWHRLAIGPCYPIAVHNVQHVGECLAQLIRRLEFHGAKDLHVIGFSLGAHVPAFSANYLKPYQLDRITGLDPAMPLFVTASAQDKLDPTDANFVDVYHTNAFIQGKVEPCGHIDFYMNGGINQPGCWENRNPFGCNHHRSAEYFAESINSNIGFWAWPCPGFFSYLLGLCPPRYPAVLAGDQVDRKYKGFHLVKTKSSSPYAEGMFIVNPQDVNY